MIAQDQIKELNARLGALSESLDIPRKREEVAAKQRQSEAPGFWDNPKEAEAFLKGMNSVKAWVTEFDRARSSVEDVEVLYEFASETSASDPEGAEGSQEVQGLETAYARALQ